MLSAKTSDGDGDDGDNDGDGDDFFVSATILSMFYICFIFYDVKAKALFYSPLFVEQIYRHSEVWKSFPSVHEMDNISTTSHTHSLSLHDAYCDCQQNGRRKWSDV